jgi:hypothetical protein
MPGGVRAQQIAAQQPARTRRCRLKYFGRLAAPTNNPFWLTPNHVPPAEASTPDSTRGFPG